MKKIGKNQKKRKKNISEKENQTKKENEKTINLGERKKRNIKKKKIKKNNEFLKIKQDNF